MNKKQIEAEIKAKKEEIKQANRELSKLQEELKKSGKKYFHVGEIRIIHETTSDLFNIDVSIATNKSMDEVIRAIESLSDPVKPKSYVDWDKIPNGFDWVSMDKDGKLGRYRNKPIIREHMSHWSDGNGIYNVLEEAILFFPKDWRESLIHRPGVKE